MVRPDRNMEMIPRWDCPSVCPRTTVRGCLPPSWNRRQTGSKRTLPELDQLLTKRSSEKRGNGIAYLPVLAAEATRELSSSREALHGSTFGD